MGERGRRYPKIGTYGDMREGVRSNADVTTMYSYITFCTYEIIFPMIHLQA